MKIAGLVGTLSLALAAGAAVTLAVLNNPDSSVAKTDLAETFESNIVSYDGGFSGIVLGDAPAPEAVEHHPFSAAVRQVPEGMEWVKQTPPLDTEGVGLKTDEGVFVGVVLPFDTREDDTVSSVLVASPPPGGDESVFTGMVLVDPQGEKHELEPGKVITFIAASAMTWMLLDKDGNEVATKETELTDEEGRSNKFQSDPIVAKSNQVIDIPGDFNGDMDDTKVTIDGKPATIIAENPRGAIFAVPDLGEKVGDIECIVEEAGVEHEIPMVAMSLSLQGPKTMTLGQTANLTVIVTGLGSLEDLGEDEMVDSIYIKYRNDTPTSISFPDHNLDAHAVVISDIRDGTYTFEVPFTAEAPGSFGVTAWSWVYLVDSYGVYCTGRQCCSTTCGTCTGIWFCGDEGTVACARVNKRKTDCGKCGQGPCGNNHSGGSACGHWWCECAFAKCVC